MAGDFWNRRLYFFKLILSVFKFVMLKIWVLLFFLLLLYHLDAIKNYHRGLSIAFITKLNFISFFNILFRFNHCLLKFNILVPQRFLASFRIKLTSLHFHTFTEYALITTNNSLDRILLAKLQIFGLDSSAEALFSAFDFIILYAINLDLVLAV